MKAQSKCYNGHKNYAQWNQSLWIGNDEGLYSLAKECKNNSSSLKDATEAFLTSLGQTHTPDGVKWSKAGVRAALSKI